MITDKYRIVDQCEISTVTKDPYTMYHMVCPVIVDGLIADYDIVTLDYEEYTSHVSEECCFDGEEAVSQMMKFIGKDDLKDAPSDGSHSDFYKGLLIEQLVDKKWIAKNIVDCVNDLCDI